MQLESVARIEELWEIEEQHARSKKHPEGFPRLPEVPVGRYTREDFFLLEKQFLWSKAWLFVGLTDELPSVGSYRTYTINGAPVVVVRGKDQKVRAFYNVCQHRGTKLAPKSEGKVNSFSCRYHAWNYSLDGSLIFVPDEHDFPGLDRSRKSLHPIKCDLYGNLIFISFDPDAKPLQDYFGGLGQVLSDVPLDNVRLYKTLSYDVGCNWKCIHDAFSETYHVKYTHTNSVNLAINQKYTARFMFPNGHNGMVVKARGDSSGGMVNVFDRTCSSAGDTTRRGGLKEITKMGQRSYNIFPNMTMPIAENLFPILSVWPISVGRTHMDVRFLKIVDSGGSFDTQADRDTVEFFDVVTKEDISNMEDMHASLSSGGIASMPLCYGEQFIYNFHQEMDRVIGRSNIPTDLAIPVVALPLATDVQ